MRPEKRSARLSENDHTKNMILYPSEKSKIKFSKIVFDLNKDRFSTEKQRVEKAIYRSHKNRLYPIEKKI